MDQFMKALKGKVNPKVGREVLEGRLKKELETNKI